MRYVAFLCISCLAFVAVATGVAEPIDEGLALIDKILKETGDAISAHQVSDPCAGLTTNAATLTTLKSSKTAALGKATNTVTTIEASIATKTARKTECGGLITASASDIQKLEATQETLKATSTTVSTSWSDRIAEAQKVIDQISAFQELIIGGKKLSLLQSSLLQLGEMMSFPQKSILDAQPKIAALVGKQGSGANLNPSMIEEGEATEKLKELFAKLKAEVQVHLAKLQADKAAEENQFSTQISTTAAAITAEADKKAGLEKEVSDLTVELASLDQQKTAATTAVFTAQTELAAAEKNLADNAAAITACEKKFAADLKLLQDENKSVLDMKDKLIEWKTGKKPDSFEAENVKRVTVLGAQVTCTTTIDNYVKTITYDGKPIAAAGDVNNWESNKVFTFATVPDGVLEIMGHDQEGGNIGHCNMGGFAIFCDSTGDEFWDKFDSSKRENILAAGGLDANSDLQWSPWHAPATSTSGFYLPAQRTTPKLCAANGPRYMKFKMGPSVTGP